MFTPSLVVIVGIVRFLSISRGLSFIARRRGAPAGDLCETGIAPL
jgi:hypothetical protein